MPLFSRRCACATIFVLIAVVGPCLLPDGAAALKVKINCNNVGQTINGALAANVGDPALVIVVKGTCTENVLITRDDLTIKTNGIAPASIVAADLNQAAVRVDGARRVVINGVVANGLTISTGRFGIAATRGSTLDVKNCAISGASNGGLVSSTNSVVWVDGCSVTGNGGSGMTAANTASLFVTNSTVSLNAGTGINALRGSYVRVGQDEEGSLSVKPVTVSGNQGNGIAISEGSSGTLVGGTVSQNTSTGIFVGRASSGQIGLGSNGLTGGVSVTNGGGTGISVEGGNATIAFSTITDNQTRGINVNNGGSARIGVVNGPGFGANDISGNGSDGIGIFHASAAYIGGNTIDGNTAMGINIGQAAASIVGGNAITNNGQSGIFVRAGQALVGDSGFGPPDVVNTISGNGATVGGNTGGVFAFEGGNLFVFNAIISNNTGAAVQAFEAGVIELRGSTAVTVPAAGTTDGALIQFGSTLRVRDTASIVSSTGHGISASNLAAINIRDGNTVQGVGALKFGVNCFVTAPMTASAATLTGSVTGVSGGAGQSSGCNLFP